MNETDILFQLPYGEVDVASLVKQLESRKIPLQGNSSKEDLSELLRMTLEKTQSPSVLIELRHRDISAVKYSNKKDYLIAKLKSRGLHCTGTKDVLIGRLCDRVQKEKASFERQLTAQERHKGDLRPQQKQVVAQHLQRESPRVEQRNDRAPHQEKQQPENSKIQNKENNLTKEQLERMEQNRKRALELQARNESAKRQAVASPTAVKGAPSSNFSAQTTPDRKVAGAAVVTDDKTFKAAATAITPDTLRFFSASKAVNPYVSKKMTSPPRVSHTEEAWSPEDSTQNTCFRCGDPSGTGLCIVWEHSGNIQRERTVSGLDQFRWDCCGRLDPQPCFVGLHRRPPLHQYCESLPVLCRCDKPAHLKRTKKRGYNAGRYFFRCNATGFGNCDYFYWADKAFGLTRQVPGVAHDGFRDWEYPWSNPYGEPDLMKASDETKRKRLVAALLLKEMCASVDGSTGVTRHVLPFHDLAGKVMEYLSFPETILDKLCPLRPDQVAHRFSSLAAVQDVTKAECEEILMDMLTNNEWVRSIGVRSKQNGNSKEDRMVRLSGLEAYLAA